MMSGSGPYVYVIYLIIEGQLVVQEFSFPPQLSTQPQQHGRQLLNTIAKKMCRNILYSAVNPVFQSLCTNFPQRLHSNIPQDIKKCQVERQPVVFIECHKKSRFLGKSGIARDKEVTPPASCFVILFGTLRRSVTFPSKIILIFECVFWTELQATCRP